MSEKRPAIDFFPSPSFFLGKYFSTVIVIKEAALVIVSLGFVSRTLLQKLSTLEKTTKANQNKHP